MKVRVIKSFPDFVEKKRRMVNETFDITDEARAEALIDEGYIVKEEESECKNCIDESNQNINVQLPTSTSQDSNADNTSAADNQDSNVDNNSTVDNQDLDPQNSANQDTVLTSSENTSNSLSDEKPKVVRKAQIKKKDE